MLLLSFCLRFCIVAVFLVCCVQHCNHTTPKHWKCKITCLTRIFSRHTRPSFVVLDFRSSWRAAIVCHFRNCFYFYFSFLFAWSSLLIVALYIFATVRLFGFIRVDKSNLSMPKFRWNSGQWTLFNCLGIIILCFFLFADRNFIDIILLLKQKRTIPIKLLLFKTSNGWKTLNSEMLVFALNAPN